MEKDKKVRAFTVDEQKEFLDVILNKEKMFYINIKFYFQCILECVWEKLMHLILMM